MMLWLALERIQRLAPFPDYEEKSLIKELTQISAKIGSPVPLRLTFLMRESNRMDFAASSFAEAGELPGSTTPASILTFRGFGDLEELRLTEVGGEDLQADGEIGSAVEVGDAAGHRDAGDAGEVGGEGEDV